MRERTKALTLSALCAALSFVILALSMVLPAQRLALLCLSSLGAVACLCSCGGRWALGSYAVTALLSVLLLPEKSMPLAYAIFCGYYPVLKLRIEKLPAAAGRYALKLLCFNAAFAAFYYLVRLTFGLHPALLIPAANGAFLLYDYALGKLILLYIRTIHGRIEHG